MANADLFVPTSGGGLDWPRRAANAINTLLRRVTGAEKAAEALADRVGAVEANHAILDGDVEALTERIEDAETALSVVNGFTILPDAPTSPVEGRTYYDTALHMMRTWDGTAWQAHWTV